MATPTVCLVMKQTAPLGCDAQQLLRCLSGYAALLAAPWGAAGLLRAGAPAAGDWPLYVLDDPEQAVALGLAAADEDGVLGYHEDPAGTPRGLVFVRTAAAEGTPTSVVASHELAELLADPGANQCCLSAATGRFVAAEVCDPVQGDTFPLAGLPVSNFVLPPWFGGPGGPPYDHMGLCARPWELRPGGYALVSDGGAWQQVFGSAGDALAYAKRDTRLRRVALRRRRGRPGLGVAGAARPSEQSVA